MSRLNDEISVDLTESERSKKKHLEQIKFLKARNQRLTLYVHIRILQRMLILLSRLQSSSLSSKKATGRFPSAAYANLFELKVKALQLMQGETFL